MIELIQSLMVRIFAGGIICAAAMILAGDGAKKEIVRLCCACLMIIFVLTPVQGADFSLDALLSDREDVERQINSALSTAQEDQLERVRQELDSHVRSRGVPLGVRCTAEIDCHLDSENALVIDSITVRRTAGGADALADLRGQLAADFALEERQIILMEAESP